MSANATLPGASQAAISSRLATELDAEAAWSLLASSGYLDETSPRLRPTQRDAYLRTWPAARRDHHVLLAYRGHQPVGTVAVSHALPGTWLLQHFGVDAACRRDRHSKYAVCEALFVGIAAQAQRAGARALLSTCDRRKPFNTMVYGGFAARSDQDTCSLRPITVRKHELQPGTRGPAASACTRDGDADTSRDVARALALHLPPVEAAALAFSAAPAVPAWLDTTRGWPGLCRRHVRVARDHAGAAAVLLADSADHGVNLFGLSNACRIVPLPPAARIPWRLRAALLADAVAHYASLRVPEFVFLDDAEPHADEAQLASLGFSPPIPGMIFALAGHGIALWQEHLAQVFAARRAQR
jgi:hypothetical protein